MPWTPAGKTVAEIVSTPEGVAWIQSVDFQRPQWSNGSLVYVGDGGYTLPCTGQVVDLATGQVIGERG